MIYTLTLNPALDRELTVPELTMDKVLRVNTTRIDCGGKGFNVSRALRALGAESIAIGFMGGPVGDQLATGLSQMGIHTDFVSIHGETRTNISIVDSRHTHYIKANEPGPVVSGIEACAMLDKIASLARHGDWWILAGSTPPGIQPAYISDIIARIKGARAKVVLDMEGAYLRAGCTAGAFLVKPNSFEASVLIGVQISNLDEAIHALPIIHGLGAKQVAISLGKLGGVYSDGTHTWWAKAPVIDEHNPIGAGDAMLAGMVWALHKGLTGSEVLRWGLAGGAAAASLDGTAVGSYALVESLSAKLTVEMVTV